MLKKACFKANDSMFKKEKPNNSEYQNMKIFK